MLFPGPAQNYYLTIHDHCKAKRVLVPPLEDGILWIIEKYFSTFSIW